MAETLYIDGTALPDGQISGYRIAFTVDDSSQLSYEQSVSLDGSEIRSDELYVTLRCRRSVVTVRGDALPVVLPDNPDLVVTGYVEYRTVNDETFITVDGETFMVPVTADLAEVWLGMFRGVSRDTPVWYDNGAGRLEKYYWKSMKRVARYDFELTAQSPIGRLTSGFEGGLYDGEPLRDALFAILKDTAFTIDPRIELLPVYGWLPYQSRRECLRMLSVACGFVIRRSGGALYFTLPGADASELPDVMIYNGGSVNYRIGETYARADVTEYEFRQTVNDREVTLFDNTGGSSVTAYRVIFSEAPVYNLVTSGNLRIDGKESGEKDCGVNYATVSGVGVLKGTAYTKVSGVVSFDGDPAADPEHILTVDNVPLVSSLNSATVAAKYLAGANESAVVEMDFIRETQSAGDLLSFADPYGAARTGYLLSMSGRVTSIDRVTARFLCGYAHHWGNTYNVVTALTESTGEWTVPATLDGKTIRVALISGGQGGESGQHGTDNGADGRGNEIRGGGRGSRGSGGKINVFTISVSAGETFAYRCGAGGAGGQPSGAYDTDDNGRKTYRNNPGGAGGASSFGAYSSDGGAASEIGYRDIIHGTQYALPGPDNGVDGGRATTATERPKSQSADWYPYWTDIAQTPVVYPWGSDEFGNEISWLSGSAGYSHTYTQTGEYAFQEWAYGGLGGGAAMGNNGGDGADVNRSYADTGGRGGNGANADALFPADTREYGAGGSGGHGGGEGGAGGSGHSTEEGNSGINGARGVGGSGSAGQDGKAGCILIYYHN